MFDDYMMDKNEKKIKVIIDAKTFDDTKVLI